MKKVFLHLVLIIIVFSTSAQKIPKPPFKVSKQQMYEDYDQFLHIIQTYCPQLEIRQKTGYDIMAILFERRNKIAALKTYWDFIQFMDGSVDKMLDMHASRRNCFYSVPNPRYAPGQSFYDSTGISAIAHGMDIFGTPNRFRKRNQINLLRAINAKYIDGQYYSSAYFEFKNNQTQDSICLRNARIIACNRQPVDKYVRQKMFNELPAYHLLWDVKREKYFTDQLLVDFNNVLKVENEDGVVYEFVPNHYGVKIQHVSNKEIRNNFEEYLNSYISWASQFVSYLPEEKVLYIYIEQMFGQENYNLLDSIKKIGRNKEIEKVVIDVRNNLGGGDEYWMNILAAIIKHPICFEINIALNGNNDVMAYLSAEFPIEMTNTFRKDTITFLDNKIMWISHENDTIFPDTNSLEYDGKIYVLQGYNTASAAHSFTSVAWQIPQMISIGVSSGQIAGFGLNPWGFQLKHSHYTFSFEPALDISTSKKWQDVFHCIPEIEVSPTIQDINNEIYRGSMSPEEFLPKYDYLFKYIMNLQ
ncbi:MAG: hypothetical protein J5606_02420 [Bacteroidales bacterium]|nr:hypothetical protein [Bacteroidales bacterium]